MILSLDNVNTNSSSGPNSFASKLLRYFPDVGVFVDNSLQPDAYLCFIETQKKKFDKPMYQRLDGIYFNTLHDYTLQNRNIKRTYEMAKGVIFQSRFNERLISHYFGIHDNSTTIHNGADLVTIEKTPPLSFDRYENLWCCAASWRPHKRLNENIRYFLEHSGPNDGLMIAGLVPKEQKVKNNRIHYVGVLNQLQLYSLYKKSKYFIHLAWLDHCPNVVVDARACGCQIICTSAGGTVEIAGKNAVVVQEEEWDLKPVQLYNPPKLNFENKLYNTHESELDMLKVAKKYKKFIKG